MVAAHIRISYPESAVLIVATHGAAASMVGTATTSTSTTSASSTRTSAASEALFQPDGEPNVFAST